MRFLNFRKPLLTLLVAMISLNLIAASIYMLGMEYLEGDPRTFSESLQWAAESLTTTGYGTDGRWSHPLMTVFVTLVQYSGVFIIFLIIPIYLIPFLEERFEVRLPKDAGDMSRHVIIYNYGPAVATLIDELESESVPTLIIDEDETKARQLIREGKRVLLAGLFDKALTAGNLHQARALIANGSDDNNATVVLIARQLGFEGSIYTLVEDPFHRKPLALAGATAVFTPRHMLGAALAARASERISPRISGLLQLGRHLEVTEVRIPPRSPLVGQTLVESNLGARTGVNIIAIWANGQFTPIGTSHTRIQANDILVIIGAQSHVAKLINLVGPSSALKAEGRFIVAGFGEVGRKVHELLDAVGEDVLVIDKTAQDGVDMVGDALDHDVINERLLADVKAVILALDSDSATLFATVVIKDLAPEVRVIARVNRAENVERIHRAGAEFALSISEVSGQIIARRLLGEESVSVNTQLKVKRLTSERVVGQGPTALRVRESTGCSVVAVERGDQVIVHFSDPFTFAHGDAIFVCGDNDAIQRFQELYC